MRTQSKNRLTAWSAGKCLCPGWDWFLVLHLIDWERGTVKFSWQITELGEGKPKQSGITLNTQLKNAFSTVHEINVSP